jgi:hypothetical protein
MKHKYLVKNNNEEFYFDKKNDFIIYCQSQYNDWYKIHTQNKNSSYNKLQNIEITFSYDGGQTWNDIADFKHVRQLIQNEKKLTSPLENNDSSEKTNSGNSWFTYLSIIFFIWCALSFLNVKVKRIGFINDFNTSVFGRESKLVRPSGINKTAIDASHTDNEVNTLIQENDENSFTQSAINEYNNSIVFKDFQPSEEDKHWILTIKSDPNSDPNGSEGSYCQTGYKCKWCSGEVPGKNVSLKNQLNNWENSLNTAMAIGLLKTIQKRVPPYDQVTDEEIRKTRDDLFKDCKQIINLYKNGDRYICVINGPQYGSTQDFFCSKKCQNEFNLYR